ncbi:helix-turn-helix domain-containing protein [Halorhabdus rudnickae]|uniref:helix-turn-helix domain-containing protein n=1 Tax=Halorhabdus rudnickae TaxID=1775544 RepID=UPI0010831FFE|nr:helix-turn-helix domain-containing protein [Halorhabdus rudnickae]
MALRAVYEITCEHLPFVSVAASVPETTLQVQLVASQDEYTPFVVTVTAGAASAVEAAFDSSSFVAGYTRIDHAEDRPRYKVLPAVSMSEQFPAAFDVGGLQALADNGSVIDCNRVTSTGWIQSGRFASRETVTEIRDFWEHNGAFELRKLERVSDDRAADAVTERQREALLAAREMGYFDVPRDAALADVAAKLDISASSLSERLRRGHRSLIAASLDDPDG